MGHGGKAGPAGRVCHVTSYMSTKFHSNPSTPSRGFPGPPSTPAVSPDLFGRGSASPDLFRRGSPRPGSARLLSLGDFPAVVFRGTARANGEREKVEIWQGDAPRHVLTPCEVSSQSDHSFYRLPGPYRLSTGFSPWKTAESVHQPPWPR